MEKYHRRSIRLPGYDYTQCGAYFITIVTAGRENLFGEIRQGEMVLNEMGDIVRWELEQTPVVRPEVELDSFVIMPNHVHTILVITSQRPQPNAHRSAGAPAGSVGAVVGQIKSLTARKINHCRGTHGAAVWQRNYFEHVIRNVEEWDRIRGYIETNPDHWQDDQENPHPR
jgi:putative transposase